MKRILFFVFFAAVSVAWCTSGFAVNNTEQIPSVVPSPAQLTTGTGSGSGVYYGVQISGSSTLNVGTSGGAELDINTINSGGGWVGVSAIVDPVAGESGATSGMVNFNVTSNVYGDTGFSVSRELNIITLQGAAGTAVTFYGNVYSRIWTSQPVIQRTLAAGSRPQP